MFLLYYQRPHKHTLTASPVKQGLLTDTLVTMVIGNQYNAKKNPPTGENILIYIIL